MRRRAAHYNSNVTGRWGALLHDGRNNNNNIVHHQHRSQATATTASTNYWLPFGAYPTLPSPFIPSSYGQADPEGAPTPSIPAVEDASNKPAPRRLSSIGSTTATTAAASSSSTATSSSAPSSSSMTASTPSFVPQGCQRPYEVEGGAVPIFQLANGGRINKRTWNFRNPNWCDLCKEPVSLWANHHGRKDHALLDLHYSSMVEYDRSWDAEVLLKMFQEYLGVPITSYHRKHAETDRRRRVEILALVKFLEKEQVLNLTEPRNTFLSRMTGGLRGMDHQGALVMHKELMGTMLRFYPDGGIQDFSNLLDFISCAYNLETVYDLGGYSALDPAAKDGQMKLGSTSPSAMGLGGAAVGSTAAHGFGATAQDAAKNMSEGDGAMTDQEHAEAFSRKAIFVRLIFGQLRWVTVEDQVHPTGRVFPHHIVLSCELLLKMLMAECIAVRICEYMVRVESVWRQHGLERKKRAPREVERRQETPNVLRYSYRPMSTTYEDLYSLSNDEAAHRQAIKEELTTILKKFGTKEASLAMGKETLGRRGSLQITDSGPLNTTASSSSAPEPFTFRR